MNNKENIEKNFFSRNFNKFIIVILYILFLAFFLYLPNILNIFSTRDRVINVYTFTDMISPETAYEFEKLTGIKINLKYFDTNEELFAKFKISQGRGYDLITPSDSWVELLVKQNLLAKLDIKKLANFKFLDKRLIGHYFDKENLYSVPYFWSTDGIIFNKQKCKNLRVDWELIFNKPNNLKFKICMIDSAKEAFMMAAIYLFGKIDNLSQNELEKIKTMLTNQKEWVEIYMLSSLQYYLFSDIVPMAVTSSAFAKKVLELSDEYDYIIPEQGSILLIDNLVIPKHSNKLDLVHRFIDYLISKDVIFYNSEQYGYNPSNELAYKFAKPKFLNNNAFYPNDKMFEKLHLMDNQIDMKKIDDMWLDVQLAKKK
jgi:spermidine/putrescine transport system substrate-binding protein